MNLKLSFPYNSFRCTTDAFRFIIDFLNFPKAGILATNKEGFIDFNLEKIINYLESKHLDTFDLVNNNSQYFDFKKSVIFRRDSLTQMNIFNFSIENKSDIKLEELLKASNNLKFSTMLICDNFKIRWQNEKNILNYKTFKRPYQHLSMLPDPRFGTVVDVSKNPGHLTETYSMVLMAAPEIWFGPNSWQYFDKRKVIGFKNAPKIEEVGNDIVYINLFNWDIDDYEDCNILALQKQFRDWTNMDFIEEELNKKIVRPTLDARLKLDLGNSISPKES